MVGEIGGRGWGGRRRWATRAARETEQEDGEVAEGAPAAEGDGKGWDGGCSWRLDHAVREEVEGMDFFFRNRGKWTRSSRSIPIRDGPASSLVAVSTRP